MLPAANPLSTEPSGGSAYAAPIPGSVLIVDDDMTQRMLLRYTCEHLGVERIREAEDGRDALRWAARESFDLVLLDVMMPVMDGVETCRLLRAGRRPEDMAILMQTAWDDADMRRQCFEAGATDFVSKPINVIEVSARVRVHLENRILMRTLQEFRDRMSVHLSLIGKHAENLRPDGAALASVERRTGLSLDIFHRSSEEVGGDFWTIRDLDDGRIIVLLADAVGHGLAAAINAFRIEAVLRGLPQHGASTLLAALDHRLAALDDGRLTAAVTAVDYHAAAGVVTICAAGAPAPLLVQQGRVAPIETGGLPAGTGLFLPRTQSLSLEPGASLVLYSDGWADGDPERAAAILRTSLVDGRLPAAAHLASSGAGALEDDLTMMIISRRTE